MAKKTSKNYDWKKSYNYTTAKAAIDRLKDISRHKMRETMVTCKTKDVNAILIVVKSVEKNTGVYCSGKIKRIKKSLKDNPTAETITLPAGMVRDIEHVFDRAVDVQLNHIKASNSKTSSNNGINQSDPEPEPVKESCSHNNDDDDDDCDPVEYMLELYGLYSDLDNEARDEVREYGEYKGWI